MNGLLHPSAPTFAAWTPAAVSITALVVLGVVAAIWWSLGPGRERRAVDVTSHPEGLPQTVRRGGFRMEPWMVVVIGLFVAGVVVMPRLLGFTFLFLPLIFGHRRRGPGAGPRSDRTRDTRDEPDPPYGG